MAFWFLLLVLWSCLSREVLADNLTFLSPLFDRLDERELLVEWAAREQEAELPPSEQLNKALVTFFLAERESLLGHPHAQRKYLREAEQRCLAWEEEGFQSLSDVEKGRAAYLCVLVRVEVPTLLSPLGLHFLGWNNHRRIKEDLMIGQLSPLEITERWYAEGRIDILLPPGGGQDFRSGLMALNFLERARPDLSSVDYFLARAHELKGNLKVASDYFYRAFTRKPQDARTLLVFHTSHPPPSPSDFDGIGYGMSPSLFYNPWRGFGGQLSVSDDRMFDRDRAIAVMAAVGTRAFWKAKIDFKDRQTLPDYTLGLDSDLGGNTQDFYGLGGDSIPVNHSTLQFFQWTAELSAKTPIVGASYLKLGWRLRDYHLSKVEWESGNGGDFANVNAPDVSGISFSGAFGELGYDSRDSQVEPHRGVWVRLRGFFPTKGMGSSKSFQEWTLEGHYYLPLTEANILAFSVGGVESVGEVPFGDYPLLSGSFPLPSVRYGRLIDRNLAAGTVEYRGRLWGPLKLIFFVNTGTVAPEASQVWHQTFRVGGGSGLQWQPTRYRTPLWRLEVGSFGSQTVVQAVADALW